VRHFADWLTAFMEYSQYTEAPRHMHFWSGVSAVAGALRRKVWVDQVYFKWYPNFYICLVAPPGIVSKSTTADIALNLLKRVPGVHFGPDVVTWPALVSAFAAITEGFDYEGAFYPMSAMTLVSSEFGNLLNPQDKDMVDLMVNLWDGKQGTFKKETKHSGNDVIENPWINLIACTTPSWIAQNFPEYMIGGGFTSRTIFVYADQKQKYVPYLSLVVPPDLAATETKLVEDLAHISSTLVGPYTLTPAAFEWGIAWYERWYKHPPLNLDKDRFGGYIARKQTHMHKLAMVLAASSGDTMQITDEHLSIADMMLSDLEPDMQFVFNKIGRTDISLYVERLVTFVHSHPEGSTYREAYRHVHTFFPSMRDFEDVLAGSIRAGYIKYKGQGDDMILLPGVPLPSATNGGARPA